jgi:hypothetical protein
MSTAGGGEIILLPAAALVGVVGLAVIAAAAVTVVGGVVVYTAGKGAVACGRKIHEAVQEHLARQQAVNKACEHYEQEFMRRAREAKPQAGLNKDIERIQRRVREFQEQQRQAEKAAPVLPSITLKPDPILETSTPTESFKIVDNSDLESERKDFTQRADQLTRLFEEYTSFVKAKLVHIDDLQARLADLQHEMSRNVQIDGPMKETRTVYDLNVALDDLYAELAYRQGNMQEQQGKKARAAKKLLKAGDMLQKKALELQAQPGLSGGLAFVEELLETGQQSFDDQDWEGASESAEIALRYLKSIRNVTPDIQRRENLEVAIQNLREYLDKYEFPPEDPGAQPLRSLIDQMDAALQAGQYDEVTMLLKSAQDEAKNVSEIVIQQLHTATQNIMARQIRETLGKMKYVVDEPQISDGVVHFQARRSDGAYFLFWISPEGMLQYKAEGFKTSECKTETRRLFELLAEQNALVNQRSEESMKATVERVMEIMLRQGYTSIESEQTPNGVTLTGKGRDGKDVSSQVDYGGQLHSSQTAKNQSIQDAVKKQNEREEFERQAQKKKQLENLKRIQEIRERQRMRA